MRFILLSFLSVFSFLSLGKEPIIIDIGESQKLPTKTIYDIYFHSDQRLFLGSEVGLMMFNGFEFVTYPFDYTKGFGMNNLTEDKSGKLWCSNFANQIFYLENDTLKYFHPVEEIVNQNHVIVDFEMVNDNLWVLTKEKIFVFKSLNDLVEVADIKDYTSDGNFFKIKYEPINNMVYALSQTNILSFGINGKFQNRISKKNNQSEIVVLDNSIFTAPKSEFDFYEVNGVKYDLPANINSNYLNKFHYENTKLWFCTNKGLIIYDPYSKTKEHILKDARVSDVDFDEQGNLWVSTIDKGLFYYPLSENNYFVRKKENVTRIIHADGDNFFLGTGLGEILKINKQGEELFYFQTPYISEIEYLYFDSIHNRLITSHGFFDLNSNDYFPIRLGKNVQFDNQGNYFFTMYENCLLLNTDFENPPFGYDAVDYKTFPFNDLDYVSVFDGKAKSAIFLKRKSAFLVAGINGLYLVDSKFKKKEIKFEEKPVYAHYMYYDEQSDIAFFATLHQGLLKLQDGKLFHLSSAKSALSSGYIKRFFLHNQKAYVAHDQGIEILNLFSGEVTQLTSLFAFSNLIINDIIVLEKEVLVATNLGVVNLNLPLKFKLNFPRMVDLKTNLLNGISISPNQKLEYHQNDIKVSTEIVDFYSAGNFSIQIRLRGYEKEWSSFSPKTKIFSFAALPPGAYSFEFRFVRNNIISRVYEFPFFIKTPFWETIWFRILFVFFTFLILVMLTFLVVKNYRNKQLVKERLVHSQLTAMRAQMNPHFMFNVLNSIQGLIYTGKKNEAASFLGKFSTLMRRMLDNSEHSKVAIKKELDSLMLYLELESARFEENEFHFNLNIDLEDNLLSEYIPTMIIQPFVENAVKHGLLHKSGQKILNLNCFYTDGCITFEIDDNGIGRAASHLINQKRKNHISFATKSIDSRVNLLNESGEMKIEIDIIDKVDEVNVPSGTKVVVKILIEKK